MGLLWVVVGLAGLTQGLTGFGFGIVAMAGLTPLIGAVNANYLVTPLTAVNVAAGLWHVRGAISWRRSLPLAAGALIGTPVGIHILQHADPLLLRRLVGAAILATALFVNRGMRQREKPLPTAWGYLAGLCGGVIGGAVAMGGPPAVLYAYRQPWSLAVIKATLLLYFTWGVLYKIALLSHQGVYTPSVLATVAMMLPLTVAASWLGHRLSQRVPRATVNRVVSLVLTLAALYLLLAPAHR